MSVRLMKANSDINVWGLTQNDFMRTLLGGFENIALTVNGNNPPTVAADNRFSVYATSTEYTIPAGTATENNTYPAGTTPTYLLSEAVYSASAQTLAWGSTVNGQTIAAQSSGIWYLYCSGSYDSTTAGLGKYNVSLTETPTWSDTKGGWYSASGYRVLGRFKSTAAVVSEVMQYDAGFCRDRGYIEYYGSYVTAGTLVVPKISVDINGKRVTYKSDVTVISSIAGLAASTWYALLVNEATGALTYGTIASLTSWTGTSGNQLNMDYIYDSDKKYCAANDGSNYYRVIEVFKTNATPAIVNQFVIKNRPKSAIYAYTTEAQVIATGGYRVVDYKTIAYDLKSEVTAGTTTWNFTPVYPGQYSFSCAASLADTNTFNADEYYYLNYYKNGSLVNIIDYFELAASATAINYAAYLSGSVSAANFASGDYMDIRFYHNSGSTSLTLSANSVYDYIYINEV